MPDQKKPQSHVGIGLVIGAAVGVATGLFLQSKKGKGLIKDASKKVQKFQTKLMKELKNVENLTKDKYEDVVNKVTDYYVETKEIAKKEAPEVKKTLMKKWTEISKHLKNM
ncbi:YtxH domain-containing protein [Candidatus Uhrbacteria bacterium]|nr:YtxH domain-containing protein [Candidatus Uhrbacteria bacterium]